MSLFLHHELYFIYKIKKDFFGVVGFYFLPNTYNPLQFRHASPDPSSVDCNLLYKDFDPLDIALIKKTVAIVTIGTQKTK